MDERRLVIFRGLPGTGKTTRAREYHWNLATDDYPGLYVDGRCQHDLLPAAHDWHQSTVQFWMNRGRCPIAIHNTFTCVRYLNPYLELAARYGYSVEVVDCITEYGSVHNVPADVMQGMRDRWEAFEMRLVAPEYRELFLQGAAI